MITTDSLLLPGLSFGSCDVIGGEEGTGTSWQDVLNAAIGLVGDLIPSAEHGGTTNQPPPSSAQNGGNGGNGEGKENYFSKTVNVFGQKVPMWVLLAIGAYILLKK
ncbi:MAG: hypothetical protein DRH24_15975 [Deltaproteobacteria bacterium]|nr:MAG: hypothetical protein DRH24_15975 [Deltaproteobacteria bacterium]